MTARSKRIEGADLPAMLLDRTAWIGPVASTLVDPIVFACVRAFRLDAQATIGIHVSADERYELYVDGERVGRGPERGDLHAWRIESYALTLDAGEHVLVARVQRLGESLAPFAQISAGAAFFLAAEPPFDVLLSTGTASWQIALLPGYRFERKAVGPHFMSVGSSTIVDGNPFAWGFERGDVAHLQAAAVVDRPRTIDPFGIMHGSRRLVPATLPPMLDEPRRVGRVRYVAHEIGHPRASRDRPDEHPMWQPLFTGDSACTVPPNERRRVIVDLENYYCGYAQLRVSGGRGAAVSIGFAESLYRMGDHHNKDDRNVVADEDWLGVADRFTLDGGVGRLYEPLWWQAGRYVAIDVETRDEPVELLGFTLRETRYPIEPACDFDCDEPRLAAIVPMAVRSLQMCMHETYVDCPYYEQLMYVGDARLQALTTYVTSPDDRLPRKAIELFDGSRDVAGLTRARTPSSAPQTIPPFSLWWVMMVRDHAWWRDDAGFIRARLPGVRATLDAFLANLDPRTGLPMPLAGWNFVDWVPGWHDGVPPGAREEASATISLQLILALEAAADLETAFGERELASRFTRRAIELHDAVFEHFFDDAKGLLAEDLAKTTFAEHANSLAAICRGTGRRHVFFPNMQSRAGGPCQELTRATIYFSHYLFEACHATRQFEPLIERLKLWFDFPAAGLVTTPEMPEPTRSDCHGWGAHPLYHYAATICGIRPASPGFASVRIAPLLGSLTRATISIPHPRGTIQVTLRRGAAAGSGLHATIELPPTVTGTFVWQGAERTLHAGKQDVHLDASELP